MFAIGLHIEGPLVSNALKCREREDYIAFKYDDGATRGQTKAEIDRILMVQGYLPGLTLARIEEEADKMFAKGYTQAGIIGDLKTMGLQDVKNGNPVDTGGFHGDRRHPDLHEPVGQSVQIACKTLKGLHGLQ